jgi:hypothetical protein
VNFAVELWLAMKLQKVNRSSLNWDDRLSQQWRDVIVAVLEGSIFTYSIAGSAPARYWMAKFAIQNFCGVTTGPQSDSVELCHGFLAGVRPSLTAIFTSSATESAFIFCITFPR